MYAVLIFVLLIILYLTFHKNRECLISGLPAATWDDWDNYAKKQGGTRAYWGSWTPGGGWSGDPSDPKNNPSGVGFGSPWFNNSWLNNSTYHRNNRSNQKRTSIVSADLANASDQELEYLYKSNIMAVQ